MKVLTVVSHPRQDSLTFVVAKRFEQGLKDAGHETEILDLHRIGFDPVLREADEPDWLKKNQTFSPEVEREIARMKEHDALAYIYPLWWYSMPAMLMGYIERVWNYGFAYGTSKLHHGRVLWLILAGASPEHLEKRGYDKMIEHFQNISLANYAGIENSKVEFLYETLKGDPEHIKSLLDQAYNQGFNYAND
jgi:NAD(P)H dehydrogenase (quinone)